MKKFLLGMLCCLYYTATIAQTTTLKGRLIDNQTNEGIPSASIKEIGGKGFSVTDINGKYAITINSVSKQLQITALGYVAKTINISEINNEQIELEPDSKGLNEVVVTALGIRREKKALGYSVQEVKAEDLVKGRTQNLVSSLQGKIAGVNITQGSNGPGSSSQIIIRGAKFLSGSANNAGVLYVIDGVPMDNSIRSTAGEFNGNDGGDGIQNISPDDIENISVLKGPNAAALYGSRAINGVIMITTKKGTANKGLGINYNFDYNNENPILLPNIQNTYGQGAGNNYNSGVLTSWGPAVTGQALVASGWQNNNFNMQARNVANDVFRTGANQNHSLAITTGNDKTTSYFSMNYNNQNGILPNNGLTRYIANLRINSKLSEKLSIESRLTYSNQTVKNRPESGEDASNPYSSAIRMPIGIPYDQLRNYQYQNAGVSAINFFTPNSAILNNPYWFLNNFKRQEDRNRLIGLVAGTYNFTSDLNLTLRSGLDYYSDQVDDKVAAGSPLPYTQNLGGGNYTLALSNFYTWNTDVLLNYKKTLNKFTFSGTIGGNYRKDRSESLNSVAGGLRLPNVYNFGNAGALTSGNGFSRKAVQSYYGLLQTSFSNWLFADFTLRNDTYSSLSPKNNSLLYPSVGLSAVLSDLWVTKPKYLSFAKIRASYGVAGRDADPYAVNYYLNVGQGAIGTILTNPSTKIDPNIVPEQSRSLEFGTDLRFIDSRINLDFTYYKTNSINQIIAVPVEPSSGFNNFLINAGNIQNSGIEATLNLIPVKSSKFTYSTTLNFARNRSKVVKVKEGIDNYGFTQSRAGIASARTGQRLGDINVVGFQRNTSGQTLVGTDGLPILTPSSSVNVGNVYPDWTAGWNNDFNFGQLSLNLLFDVRNGGVVVSYTQASLAGLGLTENTVANRLNGFVVPGVLADGTTPNTKVVSPEAYYSKLGARSGIAGEEFTYSASNMRLRQAALTYSIPSKSAILNKIGLRTASVSIYGRNLFFVYKNSPVDPDVALNGDISGTGVDFFSLPTTRSFGLSLKVGL